MLGAAGVAGASSAGVQTGGPGSALAAARTQAASRCDSHGYPDEQVMYRKDVYYVAGICA